MKFDIMQIRAHVWRILDAEADSFYLIEGDNAAAVIDTGITRDEQITPLLRSLTDKPLVLIVTHAHEDHFYHMDEFDNVYMCHDELLMPDWFLREMMCGKDLKLWNTVHIDTDSRIDLGNRTLEICKIPGHTPGSIAIYDRTDDLVFTGDAIGSGCGVWMQLPGSTSLLEYEKSLIHFLRWLLQRTVSPEFWGGHCMQRWQSAKIPGDNPVTIGLLADLIELVHRLIAGNIHNWHIDLPPGLRAGEEARNSAFGRAEITYNPDYL